MRRGHVASSRFLARNRRYAFPNRTTIIIGAALLLPTCALAVWELADFGGHLSNGPNIVGEQGYLELTPPSRLFGPGTFTTVEQLTNGSVKLHLACRMDNDALAALWEDSTTVDK